MKTRYYAVKMGRVPGIYETWEDCKEQVFYFKNAKYKKFKTKEEAQAFIDEEERTYW
jgi:ribonuclease HI